MTYHVKTLVPIVACLLFSVSSPSMAVTPDAHMKERMAACQQSWLALAEKYQDNFTALWTEWSKFEEQCQGTATYEFHRANILQNQGKNREAADYLAAVLKRNLPNDTALRVSYVAVRFSDVQTNREHDTEALRALNGELEAVLREHPNDPFALTEQARQLTVLHDYAGAFHAGKQAADLDVNSWAARFWLVIGASRIHQCQVSQPYIVPAIKLRDRLLGEQDFMFAAAACYLEIGAAPTAENVLRALVQRNPAVRQEPVFQRLVTAIKAAKQGGSGAPAATGSSPP